MDSVSRAENAGAQECGKRPMRSADDDESQANSTQHRKILSAVPDVGRPDPEAFARTYQLKVLSRAREENTIAYLDTGAGKTLIAIMLVRSYAHILRKPSNNIAVFLVPTVVLVHQQGDVLEIHTDLKVGRFWGAMGVDLWDRKKWEEQLGAYEAR